MNPTSFTVVICPDCTQVVDDPVTGYECPECGGRTTERRCDSCNKFCRRAADDACPDCAADLESVEWWGCSECETAYEDGDEAAECCSPDEDGYGGGAAVATLSDRWGDTTEDAARADVREFRG